jgi:hypothetical protein
MSRFFFAEGKLTLLGRAATCGLAAWALAMIVPEFLRLSHPLGALNFFVNNNGEVYGADGVKTCPGSDPFPQARGDAPIVVDLHRTDARGLMSVLGGMGGVTYVPLESCVTLYLGPRGQAAHEVKIQPTAPDQALLGARAWWAGLLVADEALGIAFVLIATYLFWRRPSLMTGGFFLYGLWFNSGEYFWYFTWLLDNGWQFVIAQELLQSVMQALGYGGFVIFALRFPNDTADGWRRKRQYVVPWIVAVLAILQVWSFGTIFGWETELVTRIAYGAGIAVDLYVIVILFHSQSDQDPVHRQRTLWVLTACVLGLLSFIFADVNESTTMFGWFWPLFFHVDAPTEAVLLFFYAINGVIPFAVWYALRARHVVSVTYWLSRSLTLALTWCTIGIVLHIGAMLLERQLTALRHYAYWEFVVLIIAVGLVFEKTQEWLNALCDRSFFRYVYDEAREANQIAAALREALSLDSADRLLVRDVSSAFRLGSAAVFRLDEEKKRFGRRPGAVGWPDDALSEIVMDDELVPRLIATRKPIRLRTRAWADGATLPAGTALPAAAMPIFGVHHLVGIVFYGVHVTGDDLKKEELEVFETIGHAANAAYGIITQQTLRAEIAALRAQMPGRALMDSSG